MTTSAESAWQWLANNKEWLLAILKIMPWRDILLAASIGAACGLLIGLLITGTLHKTGLLRRHRRWLHHVAKIHWALIPAIFIFAGVQVSLIRYAGRIADDMLVANETRIRNYTATYLGDVQKQLDALIEESPSLKDVSLENLFDMAIDRAIAQLPPSGPNTTDIPTPAAFVNSWFKRAAQTPVVRSMLKSSLMKAAGKVSGADKSTIEITLQKTLGQMADDNIAYHFARERLRRLMWSFINAALLHTLPFLLIPALEISLSKWRKW